jgi:protein-L-isoaspartate(D-aspartate) O-methyltransferase
MAAAGKTCDCEGSVLVGHFETKVIIAQIEEERGMASYCVKLLVVAAAILLGCVLTPLNVLGSSNDDETPLRERFDERLEERKAMVENQLKGLGRIPITDKRVIDAMRKVPRHLFIPESHRSLAYADSPVPIGYGQTISQPYIVALMTQALDIQSGMKVLEIGTGSGYQAAVLAEITNSVYTIELLKPLYDFANHNLVRLGYSHVKCRQGDGYYGWPEHAPFDRIIVTCAALHIPPPLLDQLRPGGKMIIPVGGAFETQRLLLVSKDSDGRRRSETVTLVRFVPLVRGGEGN